MFSTNVFAEREAYTPKELELLDAVSVYGSATAYGLINIGIDVNITNAQGKSLLMFAAENNDKGLVKFLMKNGANPNYQIPIPYFDDSYSSRKLASLDGKKVLDFGVKSNDTEMVDLLITLGAKLDVANKDLGSVVANASLENNVKMVRYLLKKGAKVSKETGEYLVVSHMKQKEDPLYKQMIIRKNSDFRIVKIWENYGISINENTLIKTKLLEKKNIAKYITAYKEWKADGSPDPESEKPQEIVPNSVDEAELDSLAKEAEARAEIEIAQKEQRVQEEEETRAKELKIFYYSIGIFIICFLSRKKIIGFCKLTYKKLPKLRTPSINKPNQPQHTHKPINKVRQQQPIADKRTINRLIIDSSEKGWTIDDTINIEVNYLTIEDMINPIGMTNQHERYVREMIWYIRKIEKTSEDETPNSLLHKKEVSDTLVDKWKQVNPKLVRSVYKRSLLIILQNYSKQNSRVNQLTKQVKTKA